MADETPKVEETKPEPVGTDPEVKEQHDLGAAVGPGEDYDQAQEDEMSDEDKAAAEEAAKVVRSDPTRGMRPEERADYWMKKANHFETEYKVERTKRQSYDKRYGGLNKAGVSQERPPSQTYNTVPNSLDEVKDLGQYTRFVLDEAAKQFEHKMTQKQLDDRVETSESHAREVHNGEDGLPPYDELLDEFVVPMVQKNPKIFELIRQMPDPAEASYTLGMLLKWPNFTEMLKSQANEDLIKKINGTAKQAATVKGKSSGRQPSGKLTKEEIDNMSLEDFERELEKFRAGA